MAAQPDRRSIHGHAVYRDRRWIQPERSAEHAGGGSDQFQREQAGRRRNRRSVLRSVSLRFQAEALNFTNTPALNNPNASVSTPSNFMRITSTISTVTSAQRTIRFGLRLGF